MNAVDTRAIFEPHVWYFDELRTSLVNRDEYTQTGATIRLFTVRHYSASRWHLTWTKTKSTISFCKK